MKKFSEFGLSPLLLKALPEMGIFTPTEIQNRSIPLLLEKKRDFIGQAQTGTGKTAAFGLPLLEAIDPENRNVQALILAPTRELGQQIAQQIIAMGKYIPQVKVLAVYGGASIVPQMRALQRPVHIVIATPGRLMDLLNRRVIKLSALRFLILDEADEMLNMGFKEDIDKILSYTSKEKSTWLFSATMPSEIRRIIKQYMDKDAVEVSVNRGKEINENIEHQYVIVNNHNKIDTLRRLLDVEANMNGIVFCRTKAGTQKLTDQLLHDNYRVEAIHGDLSQKQRDRVMSRFKSHSIQILVATDVAARGIDVTDLTHIIHYNLPDQLDYYLHRSGRTARAGKKGISLVFVLSNEMNKIKQIEKKLQLRFTRTELSVQSQSNEEKALRIAAQLAGSDIPLLDEDLMNKVKEVLKDLSREDLITRLFANKLTPFSPDTRVGTENDSRENRPERRQNHSRSEKHRRRNPDFEKEHGRNDNFSKDNKPVWFFINMGTTDKVNKEQLIDFISNMAQLSKKDIGRIVQDRRHSYFEADKKYANKIAASINGKEMEGRILRVNQDNSMRELHKTPTQHSSRKKHIRFKLRNK